MVFYSSFFVNFSNKMGFYGKIRQFCETAYFYNTVEVFVNLFILLTAIIIILCVFLNKVSNRFGIPMLLAFIFLGMIFGTDGVFRIEFDNYSLVADVCTAALIFIMFYGGFGTNISKAKPIVLQATLLSTVGVFATAGLTGIFCHFLLGMDIINGMLMGSVIASTDAASVFSVLRSRKLSLKDNTASLLEVESGSNDPAAFMLTTVFLQMMQGKTGVGFIAYTIIVQLLLGIIFGVIIAYLGIYIINKIHFETEGFDMVFVVGIALISYAMPTILGGNGYLSTYITGLILGNAKIKDKKNLVHFFDGVTGLMQMTIFFLLGLLATPSHLIPVAGKAIAIMLCLSVVVRPLVVWVLLRPFGCNISRMLTISFAGLRGAASIVFAIIVIMNGNIGDEIFHITFFIVLLSILAQGSLLPMVSRKLKMIDDEEDVMKTFTDYSEELAVQFIQIRIPARHPWIGKKLSEIELPPDVLVVYREQDGTVSVPNGNTILKAEDRLILSAVEPENINGVRLTEINICKKHDYLGKRLSEISKGNNGLIILIKRNKEVIIPNGDTVIALGDILICNQLA